MDARRAAASPSTRRALGETADRAGRQAPARARRTARCQRGAAWRRLTSRSRLLGYGTVGSAVNRLLERAAPTTSSARPGTGCASCARSSATRPRSARFPPDPGVLTTDFRRLARRPGDQRRRRGDGRRRAGGRARARAAARRQARRDREQAARRARAAPSCSRPPRRAGVQLRFEASVCAAIPVIKVLRESLVVTNVHRVLGIVNGTTNFMLTEMERGAATRRRSPRRRRAASPRPIRPTTSPAPTRPPRWRSSPPSPSTRAYALDDVDTVGIERDRARSTSRAARELDMVIRLVGAARAASTARSTSASGRRSSTATTRSPAVEGAFNAVMLQGDAIREITLEGPGAGGIETASAVIADMASVIGTMGTGFLQNDPVWRELPRLAPARTARRSTSTSRSTTGPACSRAWPTRSPSTRSRSRGSLQHQNGDGAALHVVTHEAAPGRPRRGAGGDRRDARGAPRAAPPSRSSPTAASRSSDGR